MKIILIISIVYFSVSLSAFLLQFAARGIMGNDIDQSEKMKFSRIIKHSLQWPYFVFKIIGR